AVPLMAGRYRFPCSRAAAGLTTPPPTCTEILSILGRSPRMPRHATYTYVREHLARLLEQVEADRDVVIINRRGHEAVALVPAGELESLVETAHLMRSPKNAERLLAALRRALVRKGKAE